MSRGLCILLVALVLAAGVASSQTESRPAMSVKHGLHQLQVQPAFQTVGPPLLPMGVPAPMVVSLMNPSGETVSGTIRLEPLGQVALNRTEIPFEVEHGGFASWIVIAWANGTEAGVRASVPEYPAEEFTATEYWRVAPPLSVRVLTPDLDMNVGAKEPVPFRANVTNLGDAPLSMPLRLVVDDARIAEIALDPPLAPGETRAVDFGEARVPERAGQHGPSGYGVAWHIVDGSPDGGLGPLAAIRLDADGLIASARQASGTLRVGTGPSLRIITEDARLGEPTVVRAVLRNDGESLLEAVFQMGAYSPAMRMSADWRLPSIEERVFLDPGEQREMRLEFVPRLAAPIDVQASLWGTSFHMGDSKRIELASPVRIDTGDAPWSVRTRMGETTEWTLSVTSERELPGARLRVLVAPRFGTTYDGLVHQSDILRAEILPAGDAEAIGPGSAQRYDVRLTALASGSYLVFPYVEHDGVAYPGALDQAQLFRFQQQGGNNYEAQSLQSVVLVSDAMPEPTPPVVALAPALLVLVGTAGLWATRRWRVR